MNPTLITAIVATLDEQRHISACLTRLADNEGPMEVIVVDGGSRDATAQIAASHAGVRVLRGEKGRARQLNRGARAAKGELLWFVHADSLVPPQGATWIRRELTKAHNSLGCFRFELDKRRLTFRLLEWVVHLRTRILRLPYGDQGLCVRRELFDELGGFADVPIFEDVYFVRAARRRGKLACARWPLVTSARRYEESGALRTMAIHLWMLICERCGMPVERMARWRKPRTTGSSS